MSVIRLQFVIMLYGDDGKPRGSAFAWAARARNSNFPMLTHDPLHEDCMRYGDEATALADRFSFYECADIHIIECVVLGEPK